MKIEFVLFIGFRILEDFNVYLHVLREELMKYIWYKFVFCFKHKY